MIPFVSTLYDGKHLLHQLDPMAKVKAKVAKIAHH